MTTNEYEWHPYFAWRRLRWVERRLHGEVAPNGDLTGWWEYREMCRKYERMWGVKDKRNRLLYDEDGNPL